MKKRLFSFLLILSLYGGVEAQVANYTLSRTLGTYATLPSPTAIVTATAAGSGSSTDDANYAVALPFNFTFDGAVINSGTNINVNTNGWLNFGTAVPAGTYSVLSTTGGTGAVAAYSKDLNAYYNFTGTPAATNGSIAYQVLGSAPNRTLAIEWKNFRPYNSSTTTGSGILNFQIQLVETSNIINVVYGNMDVTGASSVGQVGIRGSATTYSSSVNNLMIDNIPSGTTCNWQNAVTGFNNVSSMYFNSTNTAVNVPNGLTFSWAPPVNAALMPVRVFGAVTGITASSANLTWTAPAGATQYNVQYRVPGTCTWTNFSGNPVLTNSVTLTGLNFSTVYQIRVQSSDGTNNAIWSHTPNSAGSGNGYTTTGTFSTTALASDLQVVQMTAPAVNAAGCYGSAIPVIIQIKNTGTATLDFSANNATLITSITGANPQTFTTAITTGTLAAGATQNVTVTTTYNMYAAGVYTINASATLATPDLNPANDAMAAATRTTLAATPLPYTQDFSAGTLPAGWNDPTGWGYATNHGVTNNGIYYNLYGSAANATITTTKLGILNGTENLAFDFRILNYNSTYPGVQVPPTGSWGNLKVQVSADCGTTYSTIATIDNTTHTITTQAWSNKIYSLTSYAGQTIFIRFVATRTSGDFYIDLDNINVRSCFPVNAVTAANITTSSADISWTAPLAGLPSNYIWEIRTSGAAGSGTTGLVSTGTVTAPTSSVSLSGLNASTTYSAYILTDCSSSLSDWTAATSFTTAANCPVPTGLNMSAVTATSAVSTWTAGGTETAWDVYYGITPLTIPSASTAPTATSSATTYTLNGLTPNANYAVYVRANCGSGNLSVWTSVANFSTPCLAPNITSITNGARCGTGTTTIAATADPGATIHWYNASSGGTAIATGNTYTTPVLSGNTTYYVSAENTYPGQKTVGTGSLTGTAVAYNPTQGGYGGLKGQYLFTAAELINAGIRAGNISSLGLDITATGSTLNGFAIQVGTTTLTTFGTTDIQGGLTTVYPMATFVPSVGINTFNFSTPFNWDGTSNIIVSLSWSNNNTSNTSSTVKYDNTVNYASQTYRKDSETAANMLSFTGPTGSGTSTFDRTQARPKITFNATVACESPRSAVNVTITPPPALSVTSGTTICANSVAALNITSTVSDYDTYTWAPATNLYTDAGASLAYSGAPASGVYFKSGVNSTTTYTINASNTVSGCSNSTTVTIVSTMPDILANATPTLACSGSSISLIANTTIVSTGTAAIGTATSTTSGSGASGGSNISPFSHYFGGYKAQYIIRASELTAAGYVAGNMTSLSYSVTSVGTTYNSFAISMAATSQSVATTTFIGSLGTVYGPVNVTPTVGLNTYNFSSPFNWDGVSNIAVQICWSNNNTGGTASEVRYGATSFPSVSYYRNDSETPSTMCGQATATGTISNRPFLILSGQKGAQGAGSLNWTWNPGSINSNTTTVTPVNNGTVASTESYTVLALNTVNSCTNSAVVTVTVNPLPTVTASASQSTICQGNSSTLTATGATSYTWSTNSNSATITVSPSSGTTYTVTGANSFGCVSKATVSMNVNALPSVSANTSNTAICAGGSATLTAGGANTYTWTSGGNAANETVTPSANTTYTVTGTDNNGCSANATVSVVVNALPSVSASTSNTAICAGGSATLTANGANAYAWSSGGNAANETVTPSANTTYTVTGTDNNGCSADATVSVNVNALPSVSASTSNTAICAGGSATLTANGANAYAWSSGGNAANETVTPSANTTYTVTGTDNNGCSADATVSVDVNALPSVSASTSNTAICAGSSATLTASGANAYAWSSGGNAANETVTPSANTTYTVTGTDNNGCSSDATVSVDVNALPSVSASTSNTAICAGGSATLTASGANAYAWSSGGNAANETVTPSANTTYTVTGTDNNGCSADATVSVDVNALPSVSASTSNTAICAGSSATLTASGANSYAWSSGGNAANETVTPSSNTTYTVTGTDNNGCSADATVSVNVNASPSVSATATQTLLCDDGSTGSSQLNVITSAGSYTWSTGENTQTINVTPTVTTVYTVTVDDGTCSNWATIQVSVSNCTGIKESVAGEISVYPNPNNGIVHVSIPSNFNGKLTMELYDAIGKLVIKQELSNGITTINTTDLIDGIYLFRIKNQKEEVKTGRIIKQ